jgi:hypothetical protein
MADAMTDDAIDAVHDAARRAVSAWIAVGDEKSGRQLRDVLHALSVVGGGKRRLCEFSTPTTSGNTKRNVTTEAKAAASKTNRGAVKV